MFQGALTSTVSQGLDSGVLLELSEIMWGIQNRRLLGHRLKSVENFYYEVSDYSRCLGSQCSPEHVSGEL